MEQKDTIEHKGLLKRIKEYDSMHKKSSHVGNGRHVSITEVEQKTVLELMLDSEEIIPLTFNCYVGPELIGQRVTYRLEVTTTESPNTFSGPRPRNEKPEIIKQVSTSQELIPDDNKLPSYKTHRCIYGPK